MKSFYYVVKNKNQEVLKGAMRAASEEEVQEHFRKHGYLVLSVENESQKSGARRNVSNFDVSRVIPIVALAIIIGVIYAYFKMNPAPLEKPSLVPDQVVTQPELPLAEEKLETRQFQDNALSRASSQAPVSLPEDDLTPEDDIIRISIKGEPQEQVSSEPPSSYYQALESYKMGKRTRERRFLEEAIRYAQYVLSSSADKRYKDEMSRIVRDSRRIIWDGKSRN